MVITENKVWAISDHGKLSVFSAVNGDKIDLVTELKDSMIAITKDANNNIYLADTNTVYKLDTATGKTKVYSKLLDVPWQIVAGSNGLFNISEYGITDIKSRKIYLPDSSFRITDFGWDRRQPRSVVLDKDENIWVGYDHGEFGGQIFVFSTTQKHFIKLQLNKERLYFEPVQSLVNVDSSMYITYGLDHGRASGGITKFNHLKRSDVFISANNWEIKITNADTIRIDKSLFIGPGAYNRSDSCFYLYSATGIFKGNVRKDLSTLTKWQKVIDPKLQWVNIPHPATGPAMNVLKMGFSDNGTLFFVSMADGIGMYDGKRLKMLR